MNKAILLALLATTAQADFTGRVVGVTDGDTVKVLTPTFQERKVRLQCIDAPEKSMPYGQKAKQMLSALAYGKQVTVIELDTDRYGRTVGDVRIGGKSVNLGMVTQGLAWTYPKYCRDAAYYQAERQAKAARAGLWADDEPMAPWDWRKSRRHKKT